VLSAQDLLVRCGPGEDTAIVSGPVEDREATRLMLGLFGCEQVQFAG
jgi:hypothetical protein